MSSVIDVTVAAPSRPRNEAMKVRGQVVWKRTNKDEDLRPGVGLRPLTRRSPRTSSAFSTASQFTPRTASISLALGAAAAYALARLRVPGADRILLAVLATQMFPGIVIAIPLFLVASQLRIVDTYPALALTYLSFTLPVVIWILKGFFDTVPPQLERAAAVDGASTYGIFADTSVGLVIVNGAVLAGGFVSGSGLD